MSLNKILIPTDLTDASEAAIEYAALIAQKANCNLVLLHIHTDKAWSVFAIENKLRSMCNNAKEIYNIDCEFIIREGNIFNAIPEEANNELYKMAVITTHGIRGLKQKVMGADILKLIKQLPIPALVVTEGCKMPAGGFKKLLFSVGGHEAFQKKIDAAVFIASLFDPEICIYSILRPGQEWSDTLKSNLENTISCFDKKGVRYQRVMEEPSVYSVGYAKQTLQYAEKSGTDLIVIMSVKTQEHFYFAQADKENLLTNNLNIPVLCTSDKEMVK